MPKFNVTDAEASTLADYIMTFIRRRLSTRRHSIPHVFTPADVEHGKELFYGKYACQSCHIVDPNKDKGYIGPTLTQVGTRLTASWIFHWLKNSQSLRPGTQEPVWNMNDEDARAVTAFPGGAKERAPQGGSSKVNRHGWDRSFCTGDNERLLAPHGRAAEAPPKAFAPRWFW